MSHSLQRGLIYLQERQFHLFNSSLYIAYCSYYIIYNTESYTFRTNTGIFIIYNKSFFTLITHLFICALQTIF